MVRKFYMRFIAMFIAIITIGISLLGCSSRGEKHTLETKQLAFIPPTIPPVITDPKERAVYLASHYWDTFNFTDTALVANTNITEQAFVDYIILLTNIPYAKAESSITTLMKSVSTDSTAFVHFMEMAKHYLYDPNSPYRNDEYYIPVLRTVIANKQVDEELKIRFRYQLEQILKNRPGTNAADFTYILANGSKQRMSNIQADYTLLFFNNPDCHDCQRVKEFISVSSVINEMIKNKSLAVAAIYPDDDVELWRSAQYPTMWINGYNQTINEQQLYDLKAIPTLYLLDREKRVILKDVSVEYIEEYLLINVYKSHGL